MKSTRLLHLTSLFDLILIVCFTVWVYVAVTAYRDVLIPCKNDYKYIYDNYEDGTSSKCINNTKCNDDKRCVSHEKLYYGYKENRNEYYSNYCPTDSCSAYECSCRPVGARQALFIVYVVLFSVAMSIEVVKAFIVIMSILNGQCCLCNRGTDCCNDCCCNDCCCNGGCCKGCCCKGCCDPTNRKARCCCCDHKSDPVEITCISHISDSWALLFLKFFQPKRFEEVERANEEGRLPVSSWMKVLQWLFRDIMLGVIIILYLPVANYFNGWFIVFILALPSYWFFMWKRSTIPFVPSQSTPSQPVGGLPLQAQPTVVQSYDQATVVVYYQGPIPPRVILQQQPPPALAPVQFQQPLQQPFMNNDGGEGMTTS